MKIKKLYKTIKEKRDSAYDELQIRDKGWCAKLRLKGEIAAYNDCLSLMESVFEDLPTASESNEK